MVDDGPRAVSRAWQHAGAVEAARRGAMRGQWRPDGGLVYGEEEALWSEGDEATLAATSAGGEPCATVYGAGRGGEVARCEPTRREEATLWQQ